jgi:glycosyl transferase family 87
VSRRRRTWLGGMLVGFALMPLVLSIRGGAASVENSDFTVLYAAATFVRQGRLAAVYDPAQMGPALLRTSLGRIDPRLGFDYPLADALPFVPVSVLPLQLAFRAWQLATVLSLLAAVWLLNRLHPMGAPGVPWGLLAVLAAEPTWALLTEGQLGGGLVLGAAAMAAAAATGGAGWGFAGGALLALKPQYLPAYLALLWAVRCRGALLAGIAGGIVVAFSAVLAGWPSGLAAMLRTMLASGGSTDLRSMDSWMGLLAVVLPAWPATVAGLGLFLGTVVGLAALAGRGRIEPLAFTGLAGCLALLGSPHSLPHDVVLLLVPAWVAFALHRRGRLASPIPGLAILQAAWLLDLHGLPVSAGALALTGVLGWYVLDFRRRAAMTPPLAEAA